MVKKILVTPRTARRTVKAEIVARASAQNIGDRAYGLFQQRGHEHGHDVEDWLLAETELLEGHNTEVASPSAEIQRRLG